MQHFNDKGPNRFCKFTPTKQLPFILVSTHTASSFQDMSVSKEGYHFVRPTNEKMWIRGLNVQSWKTHSGYLKDKHLQNNKLQDLTVLLKFKDEYA